MSFIATQVIGNKLRHKVRHEFGVQDPYYTTELVTNDDGTKSERRIKRPTPPGLSKHDTSVLDKLRKRAYRLELFFSFFGFNVGWSAVIGLLPFLGAAWNLYLGYGTIALADKIDGGIDNWERSRMIANLVTEFAMGFVPIVGDVAAAVFKANTRNVILAEQVLVRRGRAYIKQSDAKERLSL